VSAQQFGGRLGRASTTLPVALTTPRALRERAFASRGRRFVRADFLIRFNPAMTERPLEPWMTSAAGVAGRRETRPRTFQGLAIAPFPRVLAAVLPYRSTTGPRPRSVWERS